MLLVRESKRDDDGIHVSQMLEQGYGFYLFTAYHLLNSDDGRTEVRSADEPVFLVDEGQTK